MRQASPRRTKTVVVAHGRGHAFGKQPTLEAFVADRHVLVSASGDPEGFVDHALTRLGLQRRVALTVPTFHMALDVIARTRLIGAVPRSFAERHADALEVGIAELPLPQPPAAMWAVTRKAALADRGVAWLFDLVAGPPG